MFTMPMGIYGRASGGGASYILPVVYYKFEGQSGNDTSSSGNSLNLTYSGNEIYTGSTPSGGGSYSYYNDGSGDSASTVESSVIGDAITDGYSVSCWLNIPPTDSNTDAVWVWNIYDPDGTDNGKNYIASGYVVSWSTVNGGWWIGGIHAGQGGYSGVSREGSFPFDISYSVENYNSSTSWYHCVWTYNPSTDLLSMYINGSLAHSGNPASSTPVNPTSARFELGIYDTTVTDDPFYIDELSLWDIVLTTEQITTLYNSGSVIDNNTALEG